MKLIHTPWLLVLFLVVLLALPVVARAQTAKPAQAAQTAQDAQAAPEPPPYSELSYPEIVRLTHVEGDVRVERGEKKDSGWEDAASGLPLLTGFSLATGATGRAEIEFEDTSTLYMDANTVLVLSDMHTSVGIPYTELSLLSGTVALHVRPDVEGEEFLLETSSDQIRVYYPHETDVRVTGYANAIAVTPLRSTMEMVTAGAVERPVSAGETTYYYHGQRLLAANAGTVPGAAGVVAAGGAGMVPVADSSTAEDFAGFDAWVAGREAARKAAMTEAMKESGLKEPIPGLDELAGKGRFFDCAPYGTCWEPPAVGVDAQSADGGAAAGTAASAATGAGDRQAGAATTGAAAAGAATQAKKPAKVSKTGSRENWVHPFENPADYFPCLPDAMLFQFGMYPYAGRYPADDEQDAAAGYGYAPFAEPWGWAVCHDGSWLYRNHRYVWVVGHRRWHRPPIRWVRCPRGTGFVPLHPRDLKDKLPINRRQGMYVLDGKLNGKPGARLERVALTPGQEPTLLKDPPKEYRNWYFAPLRAAADPQIEARRVSFGPHTEPRVTRARDVNLSFDRKAQSFMMNHEVTTGGRTRMVSEPVTGGLGGRGGWSGGGARGFSGGSAGRPGGVSGGGNRASGGFSGGGARGGSSGGGGSRGGGSSGGGGGGGARGGGGAAPSGGGVHH